MNRLKEAYLIWIRIVPHIPKTARFTIGSRIENKLLDLLEQTYIAYYSEKNAKRIKISECIVVLDSVKFLVMVAWQGKIISNRHYEEIAVKLEETGKMFGGWYRKITNPLKENPA